MAETAIKAGALASGRQRLGEGLAAQWLIDAVPLADEYESIVEVLGLEPGELLPVPARQMLSSADAALGAADNDGAGLQIDSVPCQAYKLGNATVS
jgi:hypothetical protein